MPEKKNALRKLVIEVAEDGSVGDITFYFTDQVNPEEPTKPYYYLGFIIPATWIKLAVVCGTSTYSTHFFCSAACADKRALEVLSSKQGLHPAD